MILSGGELEDNRNTEPSYIKDKIGDSGRMSLAMRRLNISKDTCV